MKFKSEKLQKLVDAISKSPELNDIPFSPPYVDKSKIIKVSNKWNLIDGKYVINPNWRKE